MVQVSTNSHFTTDMDERVRTILCAVVESYIETAEPVGSRTLSKSLPLGVSPATIRNVMADLTDLGYLEQPHTSAGRIPTDLGYRFYVESMAGEGVLPDEVRRVIELELGDISEGLAPLLDNTSKLLAELTEATSLVASPRADNTRLKQIEFIKVGERKVYVVLITHSTLVHHKIIELSEPLSQEFLNSVGRYLNEQFASQSLASIRARVLESLVEEKELYDQLLAQVVRLGKKAFDLSAERTLYVQGHVDLVQNFNDLDRIQFLLRTLSDKISMLELLDETLGSPGVQVTIGLEHPAGELHGCAMITANYHSGEYALGALGVLGPTRMNYMRVIPIVDYAARVLSDTITNQ